tara:strand:+ start:1923 stop:2411 length:489 start_codon:yes stop_codon:yes gene_type:complete
MALIIEDGSQVVDANSYVTDAEYTAYATLKGLTVGATAELREIELLRSMDYLDGAELSMQGTRASSTQALAYPRYNVLLYGYLLASDKIPKELKQSQFEAAAYSNSGTLLINSEESNLASFSVDGAYSESYHKGGSSVKVRLDRVSAKLRPLLNDSTKLVRT